ncbi:MULTISPECIES: SusC/RagA family TonB-linked outer membrane protein [Sphingobacterium]|uniref:SusC/RagA family TonB-linked outer membrane protein n=1 Tax=Sphingobacterium TaxID=28453 RepID=UPI0013DB4803|nr:MULTISPECIES: SusC/RagA family TonB-linked outer membrane protein [unclassified Sphingobacterium]
MKNFNGAGKGMLFPERYTQALYPIIFSLKPREASRFLRRLLRNFSLMKKETKTETKCSSAKLNQGVECSPKFGLRVLKSKNSPDGSESNSFDFLTSSPSKFLTAVHPKAVSVGTGDIYRRCTDVQRIFNSKKNFIVSTIFCVLFSSLTFTQAVAQTQSGSVLQGEVRSAADGQAIEGVSISVEGQKASTKTRASGMFNLVVQKEKGYAVFTAVGYKMVRVAYDVDESLEILLSTDSRDIEEVNVVSTGYQELPKERATGSFEFIDSALFNRKVSTDFVSRLEDVVPGISSVKYFNNRGSTLNIHVRGISTLQSERYPLIVIDGVAYDNLLADYGKGLFNNINPNDIESITVLKDAAAASIWGAQSGNGVIVVTTKKGKFNSPVQLAINANVSVKNKPDLYYVPQMTTSDYIDAQRYLFDKERYKYRFTDRFDNVQPILWLMHNEQIGKITEGEMNGELDRLRQIDARDDFDRYIYRNGVNQQYSAQLRGGNDKTNTIFSLGYDKNLGSVVTSSNNRLNLRSNTQVRPITNLLLDLGLWYTETKNIDSYLAVEYNRLGKGLGNYPYMDMADNNGNPLVVDLSSYTNTYRTSAAGGKLLDWNYRPLAELYASRETQRVKELNANFNASYTLGAGFKVGLMYAFKRSISNFRIWQGMDSYAQRDILNTHASWDAANNVKWNIPLGDLLMISNWDSQVHHGRATLEYDKKWKEVHTLSLLAGYEVRAVNKSLTTSQYHGFDPATGVFKPVQYGVRVPYMNGAFGTISIPDRSRYEDLKHNYLSYFANGAYTYLDRYILSSSIRKDASNLFGVKSNDRGQPFWSLGGAWLLSREDFMEAGPFELLKLRATYGYNGNANNTISAYPVMNIESEVHYVSGQSYAMINRPPNPSLRWERVDVFNLGLDFALKGGRLSGAVEYYEKKAADLIAPSEIDPTTGFTNMVMNSAILKTKGWDVSVNIVPLQIGKWKWSSNLVMTYARTKVLDSYVQFDMAERYVSPDQGSRMTPIKGMDIYSVLAYRWAGLDPATGEVRAWLNGEVSKDYIGIVNQKTGDLLNVGSAIPLYVGSFRNAVQYKGVELSWNIAYQLGHKFLRRSFSNADFINSGFGHRDYAVRWQKAGDESHTDVPAFTYPHNSYASQVYLASTALATDGSIVKLRDIQLTVNMPFLSRYGLKNCRSYAYFQNIGTIWRANKYGIDPEYGFNIPDPIMSSLGLSFNL